MEPSAIDALDGETEIEDSAAPDTLIDAVPLTVPNVAVIVAVPPPTTLTRPDESTEATAVSEDDHVTLDVIVCVLLSEYVPVALSC